MMETPICDFVRRYAESGTLRLHMPGHKGASLLGMESLDITEVAGADSLYEADGIIRQSEANASAIFGARTFYSTEGSSQCIRAMLCLAVRYAGRTGRRPLIAAGRNVHKTFLSAAALLDFEVMWLCSERQESYLACRLTASELETALSAAAEKPVAVYLTSPDYLGNTVDLRAIAQVCHRHGALLLVDGAHGAYLKFLPESGHAIDLGADLCCTSAHKTLPVLTGGAYLHISNQAPPVLSDWAKDALTLFGSTSPSYLILQSLDAVNRYLAEGYCERLAGFVARVREYRAEWAKRGYVMCGDEPLKVTLSVKPYGYRGDSFAQALRAQGIECEFADPDFVVMMLTPETGEAGLRRLHEAMCAIRQRPAIGERPPEFRLPEKVLSIREAMLSPSERIPLSGSEGRVLASASVGCPPAVPIVICGERIDEAAVRGFAYYGIQTCAAVAERR